MNSHNFGEYELDNLLHESLKRWQIKFIETIKTEIVQLKPLIYKKNNFC